MTDTSTLTPQPGAVKGDFIANGLPKQDVSNPNDPTWPILPGSQAPNFVNAKPFLLTFATDKSNPAAGGMLTLLPFRVWGEPAWDIGRYWTLGMPSNEADFYGKCAVQYDWNGGRYVCELNNPGPALTVKAWSGLVARQPAMGLDSSGHPAPMPGYHLPGGWTQVYVPDGTLPYLSNSHTAWNPPVQATAAAKPGVAAAANAGGLDGAGYERLYRAVSELTARLEALDRQSNRSGGGQAQVLRRRMQAVNAGLAHTPDARDRVRLALWSLVATGRLADRELSVTEQPDAFNQAVSEVVDVAYKLAQTLD